MTAINIANLNKQQQNEHLHNIYLYYSIYIGYVSIFPFFRAVIAFFKIAAIFHCFHMRWSNHMVQAVALRKVLVHKLL